ncbi:hypothetical protein [Chitinolyticbacter meiyuanensis]|uniref:hypothetical protein n=1 Tax=Chitinolyticbacter meiyuanensis TaxID=682798 RepID=UPI0011E5FCF9|nr:hypothetical protein [Chitinolyticbacter meiyuanensis]
MLFDFQISSFQFIITPIATLIGVWLTLRSNNQRFFYQLKFDAGQKNLDRNAALKKDVFLKFVEAVSVSNGALLDMPKRVKLDEGVDCRIEEMYASASKLFITSDPETVKLISLYVGNYISAVRELRVACVPVVNALEEIEVVLELKKSPEEQMRKLKEIQIEKGANEQLTIEGAKVLNELFQRQHQFAVEYEGKLLGLKSTYQHKKLEYEVKVEDKLNALNILVLNLLERVRSELGLPGDLSQIRALMNDSGVFVGKVHDAEVVAQ